jgi:hypothetical protein
LPPSTSSWLLRKSITASFVFSPSQAARINSFCRRDCSGVKSTIGLDLRKVRVSGVLGAGSRDVSMIIRGSHLRKRERVGSLSQAMAYDRVPPDSQRLAHLQANTECPLSRPLRTSKVVTCRGCV